MLAVITIISILHFYFFQLLKLLVVSGHECSVVMGAFLHQLTRKGQRLTKGSAMISGTRCWGEGHRKSEQ